MICFHLRMEHKKQRWIKLDKLRGKRRTSCPLVPCGDYCGNAKNGYIEILCFKHFFKHFVFTENDEKFKNKVLKNYINVSVAVDMVCGDTK